MRSILFTLALTILASTSTALAWGERGHHLITRVAVKLLVLKTNNDRNIVTPFKHREFMIAQISNSPDYYWKSKKVSESIQRLNFPTHFFHVDNYNPKLDNDFNKYKKSVLHTFKEFNDKSVEEYGTSPWRIEQLTKLMTADFLAIHKNLAKKKPSISKFRKMTLKAVTHGGLLAHFVGDMSQPLHASSNYDGFKVNQGGLHSYFESDIVDELSFSLPEKVFQAAKKYPFRNLVSKQPKGSVPFDWALLLSQDSFQSVNMLLALDNKISLINRGLVKKGLKVPAKRKPAHEVATAFEPFIIERMAMSADLLSELWLYAWNTGGQPMLGDFSGWEYVTDPKFIRPDYLP